MERITRRDPLAAAAARRIALALLLSLAAHLALTSWPVLWRPGPPREAGRIDARLIAPQPPLVAIEPPRREASPARSAPRESAVAAVLADRKPLATVPAPAAPATETTPSPPPLEGSPALDLHYYAAGELDVYPVPRAPLTVALPAAAGRSAIEGWVRLLVQIDETGSVGSAEVHDAQPPEIFDAAALEAVRGARFVPARKDGKEVRSRLMLELEFRAPDGGRD
ncbi:MAG TPA: energy transducer TonB [Burkholderiales bacterium]|nr:energy transducer TonB [Burkholderiales bacterium]